MMKIDEERVRMLVTLMMESIKDGTEMVHLGDLEYIFPDLYEQACQEAGDLT